MNPILLILLALFVTGYTFYIAKLQFNEKNKLGGIATIIVSLVTLVSSIIFLYVT